MGDRSLVRASDIGAWVFCHRAWWLAVVRQVPHAAPAVLERGEAAHLAHGRRVAKAWRLQVLGMVMLLMAAVLLLAWLWLRW